MNTPTNRLEFAMETARRAGDLALRYFNDLANIKVHSKGVQDMASEADIAVENLIREAVEAHYPGDSFLGEESSGDFRLEADKGIWIVDPIDGTQPFINGIRSWCIAIAYVEGTDIRHGVVFDPTADEMFSASAGMGAQMNNRKIKTSDAQGLGDGLVSVGYSNRVPPAATLDPLTRLMHSDGMYHRSGSGALSLAYVGAGRLIGYFEPHMNAWDFAAGALIVREAGGQTNDCMPTTRAMIDGGPVVAAAPGVYAALSRVITG